MNSHICVKCKEKYEDEEVDNYYCPTCNEDRKRIAKEVDANLSRIPKAPVKSDLQIYDEIRKAKGVRFVNISDLGIKL